MANGNPTITAVTPVQAPPPPVSKTKPPTLQELQQQLLKLQAENDQLKSGSSNQVITFKTSYKPDASTSTGWAKAGMIMYGMQRFPVTLKPAQWRKLIAMCKDGTVDAALAKHEADTLEIKYVQPQEKGSK